MGYICVGYTPWAYELSDTFGNPLSIVTLPNGTISIRINKEYDEHGKCDFLDLNYLPTVLKLNQGLFSSSLNVCGAALITIHEMKFDLSTKQGIKLAYAKKEEINIKFNELKDSKPSLFESEKEKREQKTLYNKKDTKRKEIQKIEGQFGKKYALDIYNKELKIGMNGEMVVFILGEPKVKDANNWFYGGPFNKKITFSDNKRIKAIKKIKGYWKGMSSNLVIKSLGPPIKTKDKIFKTKTRSTWFYFKRKTRTGSSAYDLELKIEDKTVVDFKIN